MGVVDQLGLDSYDDPRTPFRCLRVSSFLNTLQIDKEMDQMVDVIRNLCGVE